MTDRTKNPRPIPLAEALTSYLKRAGLSKRIGQANVLEQWAELVGPQIAKVTTAESVTADGVLLVRVATASWATELSLMSPQILARVNSAGTGRIVGIRWLGGGRGR